MLSAVLTFILLVILFTLCVLQYLFYNTPVSKAFNKIPGPYRYPVIGNLLHFLHDPVKIFYLGRKYANDHKKLYSLQVVHHRVMNIYNPEDIQIVLSSAKYTTKSMLYDFLHPWLNQGLLTSKGEKWHQRRKILSPAFHFNILRQFCKTFEEQGHNMVKTIMSQKSQTINVIPIVSQFAINSICETAMGTQLNNESKFQTYRKAVYDMGYFILRRVMKMWYHPDPIFKRTSIYEKQQDALLILHNFTTSVIRQRRIERDSGQGIQIIHEEDLDKDDYIKSNKKRLAMLDLLLSAEADGRIDEAGIREEVDTFMFEGHDTTAMAICFTLMTLANHPKVQEKILKELKDISGDSDRPTVMEDLNNMKYLEMCIKECLRLYPSVPFISRILEEDVKLTDYNIPSNTTCHVHIFDLHRDATLYPSPDEFIPERFTVENCAKRHPFAYIPFSAGPRNCIGQKFAMFELKSVISNILKNFILEPVTKPNNVVFSADLVLRSRDPIYIKFVPRNK